MHWVESSFSYVQPQIDTFQSSWQFHWLKQTDFPHVWTYELQRFPNSAVDVIHWDSGLRLCKKSSKIFNSVTTFPVGVHDVFMCFLWVWSGVNGGMSWRWCCKGVEILVFTKSVAYELCNQRTSPQSQNLNYLNGLSKWGDPTLDVSTAYSSQTEGILPWNGKMDVMDPTMQAHLAGYVPTGSWPPAQLCRRCETIPFCWDGSPVAAKAWRACRNPYVHPLSERIFAWEVEKMGSGKIWWDRTID